MMNGSIRLALAALAAVLLPIGPAMASNAWDNASEAAYADGWAAGDNGGSGFLPWIFAYSGIEPANHSDHFIDSAPLAANSLGAPAFAMTDSGRAFFFDTAQAIRPFPSPLAIGQTLGVDVDGASFANGDPNGFSQGNVVALRNNVLDGPESGKERFSLFTNNQFNNDNWSVTNPAGSGSSLDTGISAGSSFHVSFTLTGAETYSLDITPIGGGASLFSQNGTLRVPTAGTLIDRFRFADYGTGSSADGSSEMFFNNLSLVPEPTSLVLMALASLALCGAVRRGRN